MRSFALVPAALLALVVLAAPVRAVESTTPYTDAVDTAVTAPTTTTATSAPYGVNDAVTYDNMTARISESRALQAVMWVIGLLIVALVVSWVVRRGRRHHPYTGTVPPTTPPGGRTPTRTDM